MKFNILNNLFRFKSILLYCLLLGLAFSFDLNAQEVAEESAMPAVSSEVAYIFNTFLFLVFL